MTVQAYGQTQGLDDRNFMILKILFMQAIRGQNGPINPDFMSSYITIGGIYSRAIHLYSP